MEELPWVRKELELGESITFREKGKDVFRLQEWLNYWSLYTQRLPQIKIDGDFGPATLGAVKEFINYQKSVYSLDLFHNHDGRVVDKLLWQRLVLPMRNSVNSLLSEDNPGFRNGIFSVLENHLRSHPVEVGGQNRGPWVRLYMKGNQGGAYPWCAGFVSFILLQAKKISGYQSELPYFFSCDQFASWAKKHGKFIEGKSLTKKDRLSRIVPGDIFLIRKSENDWIHTGFVHPKRDLQFFHSAEGNTNDEGSREGYEACRRTRSYTNIDFISIGE